MGVPDAPAGHAAIFGDDVGTLGVLKSAADEVRRASQLVGAAPDSARSGAAATEALLKSSETRQYRIVHFAAHAVADEIVPRRSAILLTPGGEDDGLLQVSEIANLTLNADLVVLAACHSNVGRLVRGEGLLSLSRAFMHGPGMLANLLSGKYNGRVNRREMAQALGRRGGQARARRLTAAERSRVASLGGRARGQSLEAARRLAENFAYAAAVDDLRRRDRAVMRVTTVRGRLPGLYRDDG